ncbi:hypothetical protein JZ751_026816 [Albula glossodonta]|uniref:Uncharacterized protein n=1 Tax=Albula glossodonta TaxID=121402 RepID=A0A8T2PAQ0_9TELE|nr:hypothetical protein JZ751_026816 [Albula glossodonta]
MRKPKLKLLDNFSLTYPPLLYAIAAAAGLLLLILLGLGASQGGKACKRGKPQPLVPIYEEMTAVQQANGKGQLCHLDPSHQEEADSSLYVNPQIKPRQENYYLRPEGKQLVPQTSSAV